MIFIMTVCVCLSLSRVQSTAKVTHTVCILMHQSVVIRLSTFAHMYDGFLRFLLVSNHVCVQ